MAGSDSGRPVGLGLDVGTSALKAVAVDWSGKVVASSEREYPLLTPRPGWSEQRPDDWWEAAVAALAELASALADEYRPVALGLSGQMHGMVPLDGDGTPIRPALLWNDQRTGEQVEAIEAAVPRAKMIELTGNPAITGFQLPKVLWLRENEPEAFARLRHILFPKDYLGYRLTGELYAEPCDASGSNAFNLHAQAWDADILEALELDPRLWPQVMPSRAVAGHLLPEVASRVGLPAGLDVVAGAGDNAAAAYGMGLSSERLELGSVSLGTSGVLFAPQRKPQADPAGRVHLFSHADGGFFLLGVTLAAAGSLNWFREKFAPDRSFRELVDLAADVQPGAGGVTFKPYLAGERTPHLDPDLRGSFHGLSLASGLPELVRAVLEGVAFSLRDALAVMEPLGVPRRALLTGGGSRSELWSRITADVLQMPLGRPAQETGAAYGAACLALEAGAGSRPAAGNGEAGNAVSGEFSGEADRPERSRVDAQAEWLEPEDFEPYSQAYSRYRDLGPTP